MYQVCLLAKAAACLSIPPTHTHRHTCVLAEAAACLSIPPTHTDRPTCVLSEAAACLSLSPRTSSSWFRWICRHPSQNWASHSCLIHSGRPVLPHTEQLVQLTCATEDRAAPGTSKHKMEVRTQFTALCEYSMLFIPERHCLITSGYKIDYTMVLVKPTLKTTHIHDIQGPPQLVIDIVLIPEVVF